MMTPMPLNPVQEPSLGQSHRVLAVRNLTNSTYVLRFERSGLDFRAGQYITVGVAGSRQSREYSLYSSPEQDFLEILIREIPGGRVSRDLRRLKPGDALDIQGPFGYFLWEEVGPSLFVATGTGISPFHSFVLSQPGRPFELFHGIAQAEEAYEKECYGGAYRAHISKGALPAQWMPQEACKGRVTEALQNRELDPSTRAYLCGNCSMIYEVYDILLAKGLASENIFTEVYY